VALTYQAVIRHVSGSKVGQFQVFQALHTPYTTYGLAQQLSSAWGQTELAHAAHFSSAGYGAATTLLFSIAVIAVIAVTSFARAPDFVRSGNVAMASKESMIGWERERAVPATACLFIFVDAC
jgi:hypothetical protein